jgi:starch synthase
MVGSEAWPFAKTGGLGDVLGALPKALARLGHDVDVLIPHYRVAQGGESVATLTVDDQGRRVPVTVSEVTSDGVRTLLVEHREYFDRDEIYGAGGADYPDNAVRFAFLARAAVAWLRDHAGYEVVHGHDWQAGLVPALLAPRSGSRRRAPRTVFTIHNLAYQGLFDASWLPALSLDPALTGMDGTEYWGQVSFLKAGVVFASRLTTVSPTYAREIQGPELGFGFDGLFRQRSSDLVGILNGIDYDQWDPARDRYLPEPFDAAHLTGKASAKRAVLEQFGFVVDRAALERPLVGMVSRMVDQKGFDLLAALGDRLLATGAGFVLLGTGEPRYEAFWREMAARHPDRVRVHVGFDEALAHLVEGGADVFLMPSRFEPCGLNQMYSQRYGTVPVVHATGGLRDTVRPFDPGTGEGTGFAFEAYTAEALLAALGSALRVYPDRDVWHRIQRAGMAQDFSWDRSARQYATLYAGARTLD